MPRKRTNFKTWRVEWDGKEWDLSAIAEHCKIAVVSARKRICRYNRGEIGLDELFKVKIGDSIELSNGRVVTCDELMKITGYECRETMMRRMRKVKCGQYKESDLFNPPRARGRPVETPTETPEEPSKEERFWEIGSTKDNNQSRIHYSELRMPPEAVAIQERLMPLSSTPNFRGVK